MIVVINSFETYNVIGILDDEEARYEYFIDVFAPSSHSISIALKSGLHIYIYFPIDEGIYI